MNAKQYEYQLGDIIEIPEWLDSKGKSMYSEDMQVYVGQQGEILGVDFILQEDMDLDSYLVNAREAFNSTVKGRKTIYVVRIKDGTLLRLYYDSMKLVKTNYEVREEILNEMINLKVDLETELSKKITKYRLAKIKSINARLNLLMREYADEEIISCYKMSTMELILNG